MLDGVVVDGFAVGGAVHVNLKVEQRHQRQTNQRAAQTQPFSPQAVAQQKQREKEHQHKARHGVQHHPGKVKVIVADNATRGAQQPQIGGEKRVAPELNLVVVDQRHADGGHGGDQIGRPGPPCQKIPQRHQQHRRQQIQQHDGRMVEIGLIHRRMIQRRVGAGGKMQRQIAVRHGKNKKKQRHKGLMRPPLQRAALPCQEIFDPLLHRFFIWRMSSP